MSSAAVLLTTELSQGDATTRAPVVHSRMFTPHRTLKEDPVTGRAHCSLGVLYSARFKGPHHEFLASQGGSRCGEIAVEWDGRSAAEGGRVKLRGRSYTGMQQLL